MRSLGRLTLPCFFCGGCRLSKKRLGVQHFVITDTYKTRAHRRSTNTKH
jgi:hypothetical protein